MRMLYFARHGEKGSACRLPAERKQTLLYTIKSREKRQNKDKIHITSPQGDILDAEPTGGAGEVVGASKRITTTGKQQDQTDTEVRIK